MSGNTIIQILNDMSALKPNGSRRDHSPKRAPAPQGAPTTTIWGGGEGKIRIKWVPAPTILVMMNGLYSSKLVALKEGSYTKEEAEMLADWTLSDNVLIDFAYSTEDLIPSLDQQLLSGQPMTLEWAARHVELFKKLDALDTVEDISEWEEPTRFFSISYELAK